MKQHLLPLVGLLALFTVVPAHAQPAQAASVINGKDIVSQLPETKAVSFLASLMNSASSLFGGSSNSSIAPSSMAGNSQYPLVYSPGNYGSVILPTSGPIVAPCPEINGAKQYLGDMGIRRLPFQQYR